MAAVRPTVSVFEANGKVSNVALPAVFSAPIRRDVVHSVHVNIAKNRRQAYAVAYASGEQTSAISWGTGRAVARIPRVSGGGTSRSGQGAFGNMCRKGRMFAPTKVWRRWNRKVNVNQRRYAIASALAATAVPALVQARGHKIDNVNEIPLVIAGIEGVKKTKEAIALLSKFGAADDLARVADSKKFRAGKGKLRNRKYVQRRGPLVVFANADSELAFRNIPGVDFVNIDRLNLLQLAPGGHLGRFVIWSAEAFAKLDALFGSVGTKSTLKKNFVFPRAPMANTDLARLINSSEVQKAIRPAVRPRRLAWQKKNPLTNFAARVKLNPYAAVLRKTEVAAEKARAEKKPAVVKKGTRYIKARRTSSKSIIKSITNFDEYVVPQ